jgi:DNA-3-methyladenine glycosylase
LPREFYARDPCRVARALLGKVLVRDFGRTRRAGRIVETEAYLGTGDAAAHAAFGITERNRVLFGPPGHAYVYLNYGLHYCLNVSCMPAGDAGCVLFRALEPRTGIKEMARARGMNFGADDFTNPKLLRQIASGPARLCEALEITRARDNNRDMTLAKSALWIADDGFKTRTIVTTTRIGITKSSELPLRYFILGSPFVSRRSSNRG